MLELERKLYWLGVDFSEAFVDDTVDSFANSNDDRAWVKTWIVECMYESIHALPDFIFKPEAACNVVLGLLLAESFLDGAIDEINF